jgi:ketosteroid isomerase-like protein
VLGADDDHVIVTANVRGRTKDGTPVENRSVWIYKLRGGQVVSAEAYADTAAMLKALDSTAAS